MFSLKSFKPHRAFLLVGLFALESITATPTPDCHALPAVWPPPQQMFASGQHVNLNGTVTIVTGNVTDQATIDTVRSVVASAGGHARVSSHATQGGTHIYLGTQKENSAAADLAKSLTGSSANGLAAEGYVLAADHPNIVLNGVDARGNFYAAQTLCQLAVGHHVPGVSVRDYPLMSIRGSIEGFYGPPWSHQARLDQYAFYGRHKMNTYIYTPKDDPLLRESWRELYSGGNLTDLQELAQSADKNHVDFTYALAPGLDICYSSDDDFNATVTKFEQVRSLGVHSFYISLDDVSVEFHCDGDRQKWPPSSNATDDSWFADAQAYYLNRVQKEYVEKHGLKDLQTVPTHYSGSDPSPYKAAFGNQTDEVIRIQWTGEGVFSPQVTFDSVKAALSSYATQHMYMWDNFPVNDGMTGRLFLNPLTGRDPKLYKYLIGFTSNPMIEPYASLPALANYADYTWNGPAYDADASWAAIMSELAGTDAHVHDALLAFADLNLNWPYREPEIHSPMLSADIAVFWATRNSSNATGVCQAHAGTERTSTSPLRARLALISSLPDVLPKMAKTGFAADVVPWATVAMQWATACQHLISMLHALDKGDQATADEEYDTAQAWVEKTNATTATGRDGPGTVVPTVAEQAFEGFLGNATQIYEAKS